MFRSALTVTLLLSLLAAGAAAAQPSEAGSGNEVSTPLPGDDGGSAEPARSLASNQVMFVVRSQHPRVVDVAFYSQNRRHVWPGSNRVYTIRDSKTHHYVLNCQPGEKICYGAGVRNQYRTYWGTGIGNKHRCTKCCYTCSGKPTKTIVLNP
jgi:hypothetical protein